MDRAIELCSRKTLVVQAGGNCGVWARYLAKQFETVWAIEPDLENYKCLLRNTARCSNIFPLWAALGYAPDNAGMIRDETNVGAHYVHGRGTLAVVTIDQLELDACDLIILDIEGMEPLALQGAVQTIAKFKPVLMVEENGLSQRYGIDQGWSNSVPSYRVAATMGRDVILVPE